MPFPVRAWRLESGPADSVCPHFGKISGPGGTENSQREETEACQKPAHHSRR
jgi:hypothetical protein